MKHFFKFRFCLHPQFLIFFLTLLITNNGLCVEQIIHPFEKENVKASTNLIDKMVMVKLHEKGIKSANLCSDEVFIRRVYLDVIGTLPKPYEVIQFLRDNRPNKRARLIDELLQRDEFADYWSLKGCDLLRVKSEFPINLWPYGAQVYHRWVRDSIRENKPYDLFVRELLTSSGSNFRVPPVNFYRAVQSHDSTTLASAVALTFMGTRLEKWPESKRLEMAAFFSRVGYKKTDEWKEEIVYLNPTFTTSLNAVFPDGRKVTIAPDQDPRKVFADWLISPKNPWFARNIVNRIWAWLIGRGIIQAPDDIRQDNPHVNPALLSYLEKELITFNYDLKHIFRIILNSRTYQQSSIPQSDNPDADKLFAHYIVRRLDAETLIDALDWIGGTGETYTSAIPEPFTNIPDYKRTISLADGSITSQFLELFGRPARDSGLESERNNDPTDAQQLYLLNSNEIQNKIQKSYRLRKLVSDNKRNVPSIIRGIYITVLSRYPTQSELGTAGKNFQTNGANPKQAAEDLAWALINTKEFLYQH